MFFKKDSSTIRERATVALANLQRNAYAMSMLRSRLESRINFIMTENAGKSGEYHEMTRVLELVKNSELILNELSGKIESARFLEEFISIIDSAASSVSEIKVDVENLVPVAETALQEMHDAISRISGGLYSAESAEQEHLEAQQKKILDEATAAAAEPEPPIIITTAPAAVVAPAAEQSEPASKPAARQASSGQDVEREAELA
ncbi:MAG: hypothetical protein ABI347_05265 [Nitrososphaera sp.]